MAVAQCNLGAPGATLAATAFASSSSIQGQIRFCKESGGITLVLNDDDDENVRTNSLAIPHTSSFTYLGILWLSFVLKPAITLIAFRGI